MTSQEPRDPGLQPERTALAWQRTGLTGGTVAASTLGAAVHRGSLLHMAVAALAVAVSAVAVGVAATHGRPGSAGDSPWWRLLTVAAIPALLALAGVLLALVR